ncbi:MAG: glycoside hydrolase family 3 protein [Clostridia bacterium]|nr:glycoside hydrolase family 3 protein [Clostridia bacterium]
MENFKKLIDSLSVEEMVGQILCYDIYDKDDEKEVEAILRKIKPGGIFIGSPMTQEKIARYVAIVNEVTKAPCIVANDILNGPGDVIPGEDSFTTAMGRAAACCPEKATQAARLTAKRCRQYGYHWAFGPCVDLAINKNCPLANIGAYSDDPDVVIKNAGAWNKGLLENGYLMPTLKHYPGEGSDDRNGHFCTTINRLPKDEWYATYGRVYKTLIDEGCPSVMVGHISLPWAEETENENDALPGTLSYNVMTKILKEELGFKGCIVSDAMSMIGAASMMPLDKLAIAFVKGGGDVVLFPEPSDYDLLIEAVKNGEISMERLRDAVARLFFLKDKARLFEDQAKVLAEISVTQEEVRALADDLVDRSITFVRDRQNILPLKLSKGAKILMVNMLQPFWNQPPRGDEFAPMKEEFEARGYQVTYLDNPKHKEIKAIMDEYETIIISCPFHPGNYHGGSLRVGWNNIMTFWRGYILQHPKLVFVSFGDPFKLYEFPYLKTYVNAYMNGADVQRSAVRVLLGEKPAVGKNPVSLKGFFEREI